MLSIAFGKDGGTADHGDTADDDFTEDRLLLGILLAADDERSMN